MIVVGVLLLIMRLADVGPVGAWPWWGVLLPFPLAAVWWLWSDMTGWTKRREVNKMDAKRAERRRKNLEALGMDVKGRRRK
jgi:small Trp-rich protein